jgi:hypothetical protein
MVPNLLIHITVSEAMRFSGKSDTNVLDYATSSPHKSNALYCSETSVPMYSTVHCVRRRKWKDNSPTKKNTTHLPEWNMLWLTNMEPFCSSELLLYTQTSCPNSRNLERYIPPKQWFPETRLHIINTDDWIIGPHLQCESMSYLRTRPY